MKDAEDEAFDELAKRQGHWGGGYQAKRQMAANKMQEPAQEPVAWAIYDKRGGSKSLHWPENHSPDGDATKFDAVPLYTAPPQRPWVGLTDEETRPIIHKAMVYYGYDPEHATLTSGAGFHLLAESIEQLLKERNT